MHSQFRRPLRKDPLLEQAQLNRTDTNKENDDCENLRKKDKDGTAILKVRREMAQQIKDLKAQHDNNVRQLEEKHQQEVNRLREEFKKTLTEKDEYIRMLEQMIEGETGILISSDTDPMLILKEATIQKTAQFCKLKKTERVGQQGSQLTNRLYLDPQEQEEERKKDMARQLARRKSKSIFIADRISKHRIAPMTKPGYSKPQPSV